MAGENILYSKGEPLEKRTFTVELTQDTFNRFIEKVYADGTTPSEVLEGFINDLVCGSHTRGSDERMYAEQYYDRCCYGDFDPLTFVRFLLIHYRMDELRDCMERKQDAASEASAILKEELETVYKGLAFHDLVPLLTDPPPGTPALTEDQKRLLYTFREEATADEFRTFARVMLRLSQTYSEETL